MPSVLYAGGNQRWIFRITSSPLMKPLLIAALLQCPERTDLQNRLLVSDGWPVILICHWQACVSHQHCDSISQGLSFFRQAVFWNGWFVIYKLKSPFFFFLTLSSPAFLKMVLHFRFCSQVSWPPEYFFLYIWKCIISKERTEPPHKKKKSCILVILF